MLKKISLLLNLEFKKLFQINILVHIKDKKKRNMLMMNGIIWFVLFLFACVYISGQIYALILVKLEDLVPILFAMLILFMIFIFALFRIGYYLYGKKDYEFLRSMPITSLEVVISRMLYSYILCLCFTIPIGCIEMIVYGTKLHPNVSFYVMTILEIICLPILSLSLATLLSTGILWVSSNSKRKNLVQTLLTILCMILLLVVLPLINGNFEVETLKNIVVTLPKMIYTKYQFVSWLGNIVIEGKILEMCFLMVITLILFVATIAWITKEYKKICSKLYSIVGNNKKGDLKVKNRSVLRTLYKKERKRYFASSIYVSNTIVGPILALILTIIILFADTSKIQKMLPISIDDGFPILWAMVCSLMAASSVSLSMEGSNIWILKSLPVSLKDIIKSKILWNLTLYVPSYIFSEILFLIVRKPNFMQSIWQLVFPVVFLLFVSILGIMFNFHFYSFDWEKEVSVVKQSVSSLLGGISGIILALICFGLFLIIPNTWNIVLKSSLCIGFFFLSILFYRKTSNKKIVVY